MPVEDKENRSLPSKKDERMEEGYKNGRRTILFVPSNRFTYARNSTTCQKEKANYYHYY